MEVDVEFSIFYDQIENSTQKIIIQHNLMATELYSEVSLNYTKLEKKNSFSYFSGCVEASRNCVPLLAIMHNSIRHTGDLIGPWNALFNNLLKTIEILNASLGCAVEIANPVD